MYTSQNNAPAYFSTNSVAHHNNVAVALINCGNLEQAIIGLKNALKVSKERIVSTNYQEGEGSTSNSNGTTAQQQQEEQQEKIMSLDDHMRRSTVSEDVEYTMADADNGDTTCYLYRRPISICTDTSSSSPSTSELTACDNLENDIIVSATVLFNLALSYQLLAAKEEDRRLCLGYLQKAVKLYEYGYTMQRDELPSQRSNPLYMLATINNMAVAYQCLNAHDASQGLFQHMLSTIMFLVEGGISSDIVVVEGNGSVNGHVFDGFLRNLSHFVGERPTAAAA